VRVTPLVLGLALAAATLAAGTGPASAAAAPPAPYAPGTQPVDAAPSLPTVSSGHRPGPDVLYAPPPAAPQLQSHDQRFRAEPLLVSGTEAYVAGEYLYQDYLYDDHGSMAMPVDAANQTATDPTVVPGVGLSADALVYNVGSITYPTDPVYAGNAADLVEFRAAPGPDATAYRFTLNALKRADTTIISLALDTDHNAATGTSVLPRDPGLPVPGTDAVLTTWGTGAEVSTFSPAGQLLSTTPVAVEADLTSSQITVTVPHSVQDPTGTVRSTLLAGLRDPATGGWLRPGPQASTTAPGGAGVDDPTPSGVFNVGFRFDEAVQHRNTPPDEVQAVALQKHDVTPFAHEIDFGALAAGVTRSTVPATGLQIRIFPSRLSLGTGRQDTFPEELGQLQPYSLHIPPSGATSHPHPLLLATHSNGQHYWQYDGTKIMTQLGDERDSVVVSPLGRGHDGWYVDSSEYDVFEAWADAARHTSLDPNRTAIYGYSMGGYAAYRLGGLYPDLFGKAFSVVGPPGKKIWVPPAPPTDGIQTLSNLWLENTRNLPYLNLAQASDELVPSVGPISQNLGNPALGIKGFDQLGYRFRFLLFGTGEHYTLAALGYDFPVARDFLGDAAVDRDPAHVTFAYLPGSDDAGLGLVHDHAYWLSDVRVADLGAGPGAKGVVDVRSRGFGTGDPASTAEQTAGVMGIPYVENGRTWGPAPETPVENRADVTLTNVSAAAVDLARARLSATRPVTVAATADHAASLTLTGIDAGTVTRDGAAWAATAVAEALAVPITTGTHTYVVTPAAPTSAATTVAATTAAGAGSPRTVAPRHRGHRAGAIRRAAPAAAAAVPRRLSQPTRTLAFTGLPGLLPLAALLLLGLAALARRHGSAQRTAAARQGARSKPSSANDVTSV